MEKFGKEYNKVNLYLQPRDILEKISLYLEKRNMPRANILAGMSEFQTGFLCGLIKEKKPKKIVEIGVCEGGTTGIILNCLKLINSNAKVYSIDVLNENKNISIEGEEYSYQIGRLAKIAQEIIQYPNFKLLTGDIFPTFIDEIGSEIDFLILDTVHFLPGEVLEFLCCLPFLSKNATVVMHDVILNHVDDRCSNGYATRILFDSITAEKYYMAGEVQKDCITDWDYQMVAGLPNIAAFTLTDDTRKNIIDVISTLSYTWWYLPSEEQIVKYRKVIKKYYTDGAFDLFDRILQAQLSTKEMEKSKNLEEIVKRISIVNESIYRIVCDRKEKLAIYGNGISAKIWNKFFKDKGMKVDYVLVSDGTNGGKNVEQDDLIVYELNNAPESISEDTIIIAIANENDRKEVIENLRNKNVKYILIW